MPRINLENAILNPYRLIDSRVAAILFTIGVLLASFLPVYGNVQYIVLSLLPILLTLSLYYEKYEISFFLCGAFSLYISIISTTLSVPDFITNIGTDFGDYIGNLPMRHSNLAKAFLQGDREDIPRETVEFFRKAGCSHLLALSGLHMGIIYLIFDMFLPKNHKNIRYFILIPSALLFTLVVGARPSICRAFLFILIRETILLSDSKIPAAYTFFIALFIQSAITPTIVRSVGFQLSYCAVAGILFVFPMMEKLYTGDNRILKKTWRATCITITCNLMTAPLVYFYFGTFPKYFLVANIIAIPIATVFIWSSIVCLLLTVIGICPDVMYEFTDIFGDLLVGSLMVVSSME